MFCLGAQRQGLVLSPDSANCGAACQKRLPLRRALRAYRSLGLGGYRLIHMKCGAISTLALLFHRSSLYGKTDGSTPLTGRQAKPDEKPGGDQMPVGSEIQWLDANRIPPRPMKPGTGVSPAAFWLLCRRGQSNPRRSAEYPRKNSYSSAGCLQDTTQTDEIRDSKTVGFGGPLPTFPPWGK